MGECAGSRSVGRPRIDTMKDCFKKKGLDERQVRRMVYDRSIWRGFVRGNDLDKMPKLNEAQEGRKSVCGQACSLRA